MQVRVLSCFVAVWSLANSDLLRAQQSLTMSASQFGGGMDVRYVWTAHLVGSEIRIERIGRRSRVRHVSADALSALRQGLRENDIFGLRDVYGCKECSDNPSCELEISDGVNTRRVIVYADPFKRADVHESAEVSRFMSEWKIIKQLAGLSSVKDVCR
jgi:hypothetical protein